MTRQSQFKIALLGTACLAGTAHAESFNVPEGDLRAALSAYSSQAHVQLMVSDEAVKGARSKGATGDLSADTALSHILRGTGFTAHRISSGAIGIVPDAAQGQNEAAPLDAATVQFAQANSASSHAVETVTVTSSKLGGADVQSIPISITALSQEQLTATQTAGGPDLVKQVPNLTFTKTNFSGYSIQIRGIGTQAISVTTDPAVAVALNDTPFIRNHFFEQEFFDVSNVEVLRGPQGTLYGRNATAGVVNLVSAKPTDEYEARASVDVGNYNNRRIEGMLNIPVLGDKIELRVAGEWTKRDGYSFNEGTGKAIDGRDIWSGRVSLLVHPVENLTANFIWEHFEEDDDRTRSAKQLCTRDEGPAVIDGPTGPQITQGASFLSQGCAPGPLYGPTAFQTPNAGALPYVFALALYGQLAIENPYSGTTQSQNMRVVNSLLDPVYRAKNNTFELNVDYNIDSSLTLTSQTGFNKDSLYSTEDYNRFGSAEGLFVPGSIFVGGDGEYCDPQLGCSNRLVGEDISLERAQQFSQEVRLSSNFSGPLNFSMGANFLHYQTVEDYYVLINSFSLYAESVNSNYGGRAPDSASHIPFDPDIANSCGPTPADPSLLPSSAFGLGCSYVDPHSFGEIDGEGHNYFRSQNPYKLNSWAGFGEVYYQVAPDVKLTGGLRWTDDMKNFVQLPSWTLSMGKGFVQTGILNQEWKQWTGRFNATWTPKLSFTDQSMFYGSYSRGYKGGGANPPGVIPVCLDIGGGQVSCSTSPSNQTHPETFKPEFIDAFELGSKNTLADGAVTLNASAFYYKYQNYQISQIVDRTSVNLNFNATVRGAEAEATWEPLPGLRFNVAAGYENTELAKGSKSIDLMDRTAGDKNWTVVRPYPTETSNCILPTAGVNEMVAQYGTGFLSLACYLVYTNNVDPGTLSTYVPNPLPGYAGFDPKTAPNGGAGIEKDISGKQLPNAPPFTLSAGADYSMPISADWVGTVRGDFYWQGNSFARVYNDKPYDQLHGYTNVNLSLIFTNQDGWQAMAYVKNVFDTTAITGAFLNSDDTALTTNVFVTDPRLFGIRITKNW